MTSSVSAPARPDGWRLQAAHFDADRVPVEVARFGTGAAGDPGAGRLAVGSPGKVGVLHLDFALRGEAGAERTELVHHYQKAPLQIMRPLYYNPLRPDMPYTYLMTTGGGILHGDRQRTDLRFGAGTSAHVTTQAHTKLYRMDAGYATALVNIEVDAGAYTEYLPDPVIPFAGTRFYQRTAATVHDEATLLTGEENPDAAAAALTQRHRVVAVTAGRDGAWVARAGAAAEHIAAAPAQAVDPTGAGDAFAAGFLSGLLERVEPAEAGRRGAALAARAVAVAGARPARPVA